MALELSVVNPKVVFDDSLTVHAHGNGTQAHAFVKQQNWVSIFKYKRKQVIEIRT